MNRAAPLLAVALLAGTAMGCGGDDDAKGDAGVASTVPLTLPTTTERQVADEPVEEDPDEPVPTEPTVTPTTTVPTSLPDSLGIPGADNLFLGSGSSMGSGFDVQGVPFDQVVAFVVGELQRLQWVPELVPTDDPNAVLILFTGPGAQGQVFILPEGDGVVDVGIQISGG